MPADDERGLKGALSKALVEAKHLKEENERLKKLLEIHASVPGIFPVSHIDSSAFVTAKSSTQDKIRLFRNLFRGRDDVYAVRWEGKNGKTGYSPACLRDSRSFFAWKAEAIKQRQLLPLTDQVIHDHLSGKITAGIYIGEGFDDARLDTLFLALPISWKGTVQQYVGRLHRLHDQKKEVVVYDYVDGCVPMLAAMFDKRQRGYESIGYSIAQIGCSK